MRRSGPLSSRSKADMRPANVSTRDVTTRFKAEKQPRDGNVQGQFFVDHTCIDCDTCRWMAPSSFTRVGRGSAVFQQPETREERVQAIQATLSCPTFSINMRHKDSDELKEAQQGMPIPVPGCEGVYHCGFHSERSFAASSYLVTRPEGNIMFDSPRYNPVLAKRFEEMGGVKYIVLSHIDDLGDQEKWAKKFGATRIMHKAEIRPSIAHIEIQLVGKGPWNLAGDPIDKNTLDGSAQIVHVPGHTDGSIALWHAPTHVMFTGDHLGWSERIKKVSIFPNYNRGGVGQQLESVQKLLEYDFMHVLPGHGRRFSVKDASERLKVVGDVVKEFSR